MNARNYLIALVVAVVINAAAFVGMDLVVRSALNSAQHAMVAPNSVIPVLPVITVRPTHEEVRAAFAGQDLASAAHPDFGMPFYSFAAKPTAANKG
ncbi:MAG: hypothetical protein JSS28_11260 [Proteobacteria bacterium]|nr:hypothetical protein [Pseudomonadota bacterium]